MRFFVLVSGEEALLVHYDIGEVMSKDTYTSVKRDLH
jgi:hypothetical protein